MSNLSARLSVTAVGVPAIIGLLYAGGWILATPLALVAALGAGEMYRFAECRGARPFAWMGMPVAAALVFLAVVRPTFEGMAPWTLGILGGLTVASLKVALVRRGPEGAPLGAVSVTLFGAVYAGLPLAFVLLIHAMPARLAWGGIPPSRWIGLMVVALPLAATWIGDGAAYFAGTAWGKKRLFPSVSPGKSWVGAWAGVLGAAGAGALWFPIASPFLPGMPVEGPGMAALVGAVLGLAAIVGDLCESLLKREAGMKDSGSLFPGHGGVLDRLDALTFTLPLAFLVLWILEWMA